MPKQKKNEQLAIVRDSDQPCIDRGKQIEELLDSGMLQVDIASETGMSKASVSHLKTVFRKLKGNARQMCRDGRINADACYQLAIVSPTKQEEVLNRAIDLRRKRDSQRAAGLTRVRGRQTIKGQITAKDITEAMRGFD